MFIIREYFLARRNLAVDSVLLEATSKPKTTARSFG
jgi:hypothetical protein